MPTHRTLLNLALALAARSSPPNRPPHRTRSRFLPTKSSRSDAITVSARFGREGPRARCPSHDDRRRLAHARAAVRDLRRVGDALATSFRATPPRARTLQRGRELPRTRPLFSSTAFRSPTPPPANANRSPSIRSFLQRFEAVHGSSAAQGMGSTGGLINFVTRTAPETDGVNSALELPASAQRVSNPRLRRKVAAVSSARRGGASLVAGATWEHKPFAFDGEGRPIGIDTTQGETLDSDTWSFLVKAATTSTRPLGRALRHRFNPRRSPLGAVNGESRARPPDHLDARHHPGKPPRTTSPAPRSPSTTASSSAASYAQSFLQDFAATYGATTSAMAPSCSMAFPRSINRVSSPRRTASAPRVSARSSSGQSRAHHRFATSPTRPRRSSCSRIACGCRSRLFAAGALRAARKTVGKLTLPRACATNSRTRGRRLHHARVRAQHVRPWRPAKLRGTDSSFLRQLPRQSPATPSSAVSRRLRHG